jgi:hypothetical protein
MSTNKYRWLQVLGLLLIAVMLMSALQPNVAVARSATSSPKFQSGVARGPISFAVSPALADITQKTFDASGIQGLIPDPFGPYKVLPYNLQIPSRRSLNSIVQAPPGPREIDPFWRTPDKRIIDAPMPGMDVMMEGLNQGSNRTLMNFGVLPPDTDGAVSSDFYIQVVNSTFGIWDLKQYSPAGTKGKLVHGPVLVNSLWTGTGGVCEQQNDGDPIAMWDSTAKRFLVTQFALPNYPFGPFYECIAISKTADPMNGFYLYTYLTSATKMDDYPKFGVWQDGYYMSVNQFESGTGAWGGQGVAVFERSKMILGNPLARLIYVDTDEKCVKNTEPECVLGGMLPSDAEGTLPPAGTPNYYMQFDDDAWGYSPDQLQIWQLRPNWVAGTAAFTFVKTLPVAAFDSEVCTGYARDCITQPGITQGLDAISDRLMYRLQYRRFSGHASLVLNHTVQVDSATPKGQAGIRWYELRNTGTGWNIFQQGTYAPDTDSRWMGSMAMDKDGNISLGFSRSSATTAPTMAYVGRKAADPLGTLPQTEVVMISPTVAAGSQTNAAARWGDYSLLDVAPDGCYFWYTNEYLRGTTSAEWYTKIGSFHFPTCDARPAVPVKLAPSGTITAIKPTYMWRPSEGATSYWLHVYSLTKPGYVIKGLVLPSSVCTGTPSVCKFRPNVALAVGNYRFSVAAVNWNGDSSGFGPWAGWMAFTVK